MPALNISIVIPARDAACTLADQLSAVVRQATEFGAEVVVVDNGSKDRTADVARGFVGVRTVVEPTAGVNRARNAGTMAALGDYIVLCDADDVVHDGWLSAIVETACQGDYWGGPLDVSMLNTERTLTRCGYLGGSAGGVVVDNLASEPFPAPTGANCGYRKEVWEALGGFDNDLSGAGDEREFFWRAGSAGYRFVWISNAVVGYRLRGHWRDLVRREYRSGRSEARTYIRAASLGQRRSAPIEVFRVYASIAANGMRGIRSVPDRWLAVRTLSRRAGRIVGSIQNRTFYP